MFSKYVYEKLLLGPHPINIEYVRNEILLYV